MPPDTPPADQLAVSDTTNPTAGIDWSTTTGRMEGRRRLWALADDLDEALARVRALEEAATEALTSLRTGPQRAGYAASVLDAVLHPDQSHVTAP